MSTLALKKAANANVAAEWLQGLANRYHQYRTFRHTLNELTTLSDRELSDLGLHRSMLKRVAYQAAYEAH